jgi:hypothetical protein
MFPLLFLSRALIAAMPVIAALWGMALVAYGYEWTHYRGIVRSARLAPAAVQWIVIERRAEEFAQQIRCQEIVTRWYSW